MREAAAKVRREMLGRGQGEIPQGACRASRRRAEGPRVPGGKIILEKFPDSGKVTALPHDTKGKSEREIGNLPQPGKDRSLVDAADDFRRVLHPNGQGDGQEDYLDRSEQFQIIEREARRLGVFYDGLEPVKEGGREHDITFDEATGTVLKFTKTSSAAYVVEFIEGRPLLSNGDPLEYLERLILHNEIFGDFTAFVGIGGVRDNRRIITRQETVKGREAGWEEIIRLMVDELGFIKLRHNYGIGYENSYGFIRDDVAVFDMRPANVFMTDPGVLIAVDSIPVRLTEVTRKAFSD